MTEFTAAISTVGLERRFGDKAAIDGLDLEIPAGEIYGFLGPNGAGKSTTVRVLCTLLVPTGGRATVAGHDVATDPGAVRLRIGVALQDVALDPKQTGEELLRLQGRLYGLNKPQIAQRIAELSDLIDIAPAMRTPISTYSGGMKRRVDLAAALVHNPQVLFLDEPTTGLDPVSRAAVWEEVRQLRAQLGMTIFLTTQYLEEADSLADRVGILCDGKLVAQGTPADLKRRIGKDVIVARLDGDTVAAGAAAATVPGVDGVDVHGEDLVLTAEDGAGTVGALAVALHGCGVRVRNLTVRSPSLDDVFLELTGNRLQSDSEPATTPEGVSA